MNSITKLILVLLFIASSLSLMARADDDSKEVRRLVLEKEIVPLESLMPSIRSHGDWTLLEIELEHEGDRLIYEVELLDEDGRVYEIRYDAKTGQELSNN